MGIHDESFFLVFDLCAFVYVVNNDALIYNTISGSSVIIRDNGEIAGLLSRKICLLTPTNLANSEVREIIEKIQSIGAGKLVSEALFNGLPVTSMPYQPVCTIRDNTSISASETLKGYLSFKPEASILTLYINNVCSLNCRQCSIAYKQFSSCHASSVQKEIGVEQVFKVLNLPMFMNLQNIYISGGNIFSHPNLNEIVGLLNSAKCLKIYKVNYLNFDPAPDVSSFSKSSCCFEIIVPSEFQVDQLDKVCKFMTATGHKFWFSFIVASKDDIEKAETVIGKIGVENYEMKPYFNGQNLQFFKENFFLGEQDILAQGLQMLQLFRRRVWNENYCSSLIMESNGDLHCNINTYPVGNINVHDWPVIEKNIELEGSSFLVRGNIGPCKECLFSLLCPSPGDYEIALGRNNLCNLK